MVLNCIEFVFGMEVHWDNRHPPLSSLLWKLSCHDNQSEILTVFVLICIAFIFGMEVPLDNNISHIHHCYGNSVTMAIRVKTSITHLF